MKQIIEDYKRRLKTGHEMLKNLQGEEHLDAHQRISIKCAQYRAVIVELERAFKPKLKALDEVWVVEDHFACDVDHVFTDQEEAEKEAKQRKEEFLTYYRKVNKRMNDEEWEKYAETFKNKFRVITLDQAIDNIKDDIYDGQASMHPEY